MSEHPRSPAPGRAPSAPELEVADTPRGKGVFAGQAYRPGELVGEIEGKLIEDADYRSDYCYNLGDPWRLEPNPPLRFVNHSCEPNCEFRTVRERSRAAAAPRRAFLHALRPIAPGDELTIDYAWPARGAIECLCGAPRCRGWVVAEDQVAEVRRLLGS